MNKNLRKIEGCAWCWQEKASLRLIRHEFEQRLKCMTTCLAIYQSLTELASDQNSLNTFRAYNSTIARMSGKSVSTIKTYCNALISLGLLWKTARKRGIQNLANEWYLQEAPNTPDNYNYPTPDTNNHSKSGNNNPPVLEDNNTENNLYGINQPTLKISESDNYRRLKEIAHGLREEKEGTSTKMKE